MLAALVRLLDATFMRIGNARYARDNGSFGLHIHPDVLALAAAGKDPVTAPPKSRTSAPRFRGLRAAEWRLLDLLTICSKSKRAKRTEEERETESIVTSI